MIFLYSLSFWYEHLEFYNYVLMVYIIQNKIGILAAISQV